MAEALHRLAYASTFNVGRVHNPLSALRDILSASRRNNAQTGVTGYLIFDGNTFLQVLEGPQAAIAATIARIEADKRHRDVETIYWKPAEQRQFGEWDMGSYIRTPDQDAVFRKHLIVGKINRATLRGDDVVALANDLAKSKIAGA